MQPDTLKTIGKKCLVCQEYFLPNKKNQKCCSAECAKKSLRKEYRQKEAKTYKDYLKEDRQKPSISEHLKRRKEGETINFIRIGEC
jgi:predicted nucleic acid-binding Zn ribbon protein